MYVSPHLDDAVLSAGGLISAQLGVGDRVVIGTVCTADAPSDEPLSPLAIDVHQRWGNPHAPYERRRREDIAACHALGGAEYRHLGLQDAIYRRNPESTQYRYETLQELFGPIPTWDQAFSTDVGAAIDRLAAEIQPAKIFGPLGVGRNVDHLHLRNAVLRLSDSLRVGFYEDQPYSTGRYPHLAADPVNVAVRTCPVTLKPKVHTVNIAVKTSAIQCYQSQLTELFGPAHAGIEAVADYSRALGECEGPGERVWYTE